MEDSRLSMLSLVLSAFCILHLADAYIVKIEPLGEPFWFMEGRPLSLTCTVDTEEDVKLTWSINGADVNAEDYELESWADSDEEGPKRHLKLTKPVAGANDIGTFRCYADNADDMRTSSMFSVYTRGANVTEGFDTTLKCNPDLQYQDKTITWFKDEKPLEDVAELKDRIEFGTDNATVSIKDAQLSDGGAYKCRLEINPGTIFSQVFQEDVVLQGKPYIMNADSPQLLQNVTNTSFLLNCPAKGYPAPEVFWLRGDDVLEASDKIHLTAYMGVDSAQLEVPQAMGDDFGEYTCTAENTMGKSVLTFKVENPSGGNTGVKLGMETGSIFKLLLCSVSVGLAMIMGLTT